MTKSKSKSKKKKLDIDKIFPDNEGTEEWLGEELIKEGNEMLNNSPSKENLIIMYLIAYRNWELCIEENRELEEERDKLQKQINLLVGNK